jgi:hypothetical protein
MRTSVLWAVLLGCLAANCGGSLSGAHPVGSSCTAPPAPGGIARSVPEGHSRPSSLAPHARSRTHSYGAPIQRPVVTRHAPGKRKAVSAPAASR